MPPNYVQLITEAFKDNSMLYLPLDELRARQDVLLESFFDYHYTNCDKYRKFCEGRNVTPDMIKGLDAISKIPLLDSFKTLRKTQFRSVKRKNIIAQFSSTGSSGRPAHHGLDGPRNDLSPANSYQHETRGHAHDAP
jgi:phenylacetate-coenzyme A ligase PaaK-like adenylate-forming protein